MWPIGSKKAGRGAVAHAIFEQNEIFGIRIIELIDLEFPGKNRQIPFQKVDEDLLSGFEHRAQGAGFIDFHIMIYLLLHDFLHVGPWKKTSSVMSRYPNKWGYLTRKRAPSPDRKSTRLNSSQ